MWGAVGRCRTPGSGVSAGGDLGHQPPRLCKLGRDQERVLERIGLAQSGAAQLVQRLKPLDLEIARWARLSSPNSIYAYCFCTIE